MDSWVWPYIKRTIKTLNTFITFTISRKIFDCAQTREEDSWNKKKKKNLSDGKVVSEPSLKSRYSLDQGPSGHYKGVIPEERDSGESQLMGFYICRYKWLPKILNMTVTKLPFFCFVLSKRRYRLLKRDSFGKIWEFLKG